MGFMDAWLGDDLCGTVIWIFSFSNKVLYASENKF